MTDVSDDERVIHLLSADQAKRSGLGEQLQAAIMARRSELLRVLRQVPGFLNVVQKLASDGELYRVLVSKENAALVREGADGLVKPWLMRNGRFVENVNLVRVPPDINGAVAMLAIQAALAEVSAELDQIKRGVNDLAKLITQANRGGLTGAITALEVAHQLGDPGTRRDRILSESGHVLIQLGTVIGQLAAHIQEMPVAETGFFDGWDGDWKDKAEKAHERVRGDFAVIAEGMRCVVAAYWDLSEYKAAHVAFKKIRADLVDAGLAIASERARLLPYVGSGAAPEEVYARFIAASPQVEEKLRGIVEGTPPALELTFDLDEISK
jgi:hypothetical protein